MKEILPGIHHWTVTHPKIHVPVSSYFLPGIGGGIALDPLVPEEGLDWFGERGGVAQVYLTNRHHWRDAGRFRETFGCPVRCVREGMHEFSHGEKVEPFAFGETLPGDVQALEVGAICPDETALLIPLGDGVLAVADGVVRDGDGPLDFVPDPYMGEGPEEIKKGLRAAYRRLLDLDFDHLLLAHGDPWIGGAKEALRAFVKQEG